MKSLESVIGKIKKANHLLGEMAHAELSPLPIDLRNLHYSKSKKTHRIGAVIVLIYSKNNELYFIVTQRHEYNGSHSGQISLPGGKYEEIDGDTQQTALRETNEEIGVAQSSIDVIASLCELYIPPSNFLVHPYVGVVKDDILFKRDEFEVKEIIEVPLSFLLETKVIKKPLTELTKTANYEEYCPCFEFEGKIIWGATAMILNELRRILLQ
tara:strand:+ start:1453 stop:2088 length:636 start_codon:yes stop_codon:yes gene_type:complete